MKEQPEESQQPPKQPSVQKEEGHLSGGLCNLLNLMVFMAPEVGLEPTTLRLTARHLPGSGLLKIILYYSFLVSYMGTQSP
jgi:hypothetical protein